MRNIALVALAGVMAGLAACAAPYEDGRVMLDRPRGTQSLTVSLPADSLYLFQDANFRGDTTRLESVTSRPAGVLQDLGRATRASSLSWQLPPGVLVVLYAEPGGRGTQVGLWGSGQVDRLSNWQSNDKLSQWAWYDLRTGRDVDQRSARPLGATPAPDLREGTIQLFEDANFRGALRTIGPIRQYNAGQLQTLDGKRDVVSSVRWNLPPGVVVTLSQNADGRGRQLLLWGNGEYAALSPWKMNDAVSRWTWYDITGGSAAGQ